MGKIFIFLDWSMTTNKLIAGETLQTEKLAGFVSAIKGLEKRLSAEAKLVFVSGSGFSVASFALGKISEGLSAEDKNIFAGFAFEYGAKLLLPNGKIKDCYNGGLSERNRRILDDLCNKYNMVRNSEIENYYNFEFEKIDRGVLNFYDKCKESLPDLDISLYDDEFGHGIDIKDYSLSKSKFVSEFVAAQPHEPDLIIVGGDSSHDELMAKAVTSVKTIFIGFGEEYYSENKILSKQTNIDGIIQCLNRVLTQN